jgi:hypothetical protein
MCQYISDSETLERLMGRLAAVAAALSANDQGLARIAAVHLRIPDLPDRAADKKQQPGNSQRLEDTPENGRDTKKI